MAIDPDGANEGERATPQASRPPTSEEWEARWQSYWSRAGTLDYELVRLLPFSGAREFRKHGENGQADVFETPAECQGFQKLPSPN